MKTLFQNATFITASDTYTADMLVDGEHIALIGQNLPGGDAQRVDCNGLYLLPGGVDPHVHLALPMFDTISSDDHYTGHKAAAFGGTTTALDFTAQQFVVFDGILRAAKSCKDRSDIEDAAEIGIDGRRLVLGALQDPDKVVFRRC